MSKPSRNRRVGRTWKILAVLAMAAVLAAAVLLGSLWLEHRTETTLPDPTGPYAVGRALYSWVDDTAVDPLAPVPGTKRELLVWIWYPAPKHPTITTEDYLPAPWRTAIERNRGALNSEFLTRDLSRVRPHSMRNADLSRQQPSYPVAIMRSGASAEVANYTLLAEDLASHGYVVVAFDAPYRTNVVVFPDGRVVTRLPQNNPERCQELAAPEQDRCIDKLLSAWTADIAFVLDRLARWNTSGEPGKFAGKLDMTRVGVFGHSFGGAAAAQFCHDDSRCKAGIDLDGLPFGSVVQDGLHQPFLFVMSDEIHSSGPETRHFLANVQSIYDRLPPDSRQRILIRGGNHFLFSDDSAFVKSHIVMRTLRRLGVVGMDGGRQLAVTAYCMHTFFDAYLKGTGGSRPELSSPLYPEIEILK